MSPLRGQGLTSDYIIGFVFDSLMDEHAVKQIKACAPALRELYGASADKRATQRAVLKGVTKLVTSPKHGEAVLKKTPAILMALYDIDLLEEETVLKWHATTRDEKDDAERRAREAAAPFITWLQEAEEESSAESAADGEG